MSFNIGDPVNITISGGTIVGTKQVDGQTIYEVKHKNGNINEYTEDELSEKGENNIIAITSAAKRAQKK